MSLFAAVCPFIVIPKPVYIAKLSSNNPFDSKASSLKSGITIDMSMPLSPKEGLIVFCYENFVTSICSLRSIVVSVTFTFVL